LAVFGAVMTEAEADGSAEMASAIQGDSVATPA
jgi:hypothetical protein